jgi:broad specificity phosphatase PhoE
MRNLLLIRHAHTRPITGFRPAEFPLNEQGRAACEPFAQTLATWELAAIVTSTEPKARETGAIIGRTLGLPVDSYPGLEEHHRGVVDKLGTDDAFRAAVERIFDEPERTVYGEESGAAALSRFTIAVDLILAAHPEGNVAVVTHGTVMALFVAAHNALDVKAFWRGLSMPDLVVLKTPGFTVAR